MQFSIESGCPKFSGLRIEDVVGNWCGIFRDCGYYDFGCVLGTGVLPSGVLCHQPKFRRTRSTTKNIVHFQKNHRRKPQSPKIRHRMEQARGKFWLQWRSSPTNSKNYERWPFPRINQWTISAITWYVNYGDWEACNVMLLDDWLGLNINFFIIVWELVVFH